MDEIGNAGSFFWRDKERKAPHNLYSSDEKLREGAAKLNYGNDVKVPQYSFYSEPTAQAAKVQKERRLWRLFPVNPERR